MYTYSKTLCFNLKIIFIFSSNQYSVIFNRNVLNNLIFYSYEKSLEYHNEVVEVYLNYQHFTSIKACDKNMRSLGTYIH